MDDGDLESDEVVTVPSQTMTVRVPGPVVIQTSEYGEIKLARLTVGNLHALAQLAQQEKSARDFVTTFFAEQTIAPPLAREAVATWDEDVLVRVADGWLRAVAVGDGNLPDGVSPLERYCHVKF